MQKNVLTALLTSVLVLFGASHAETYVLVHGAFQDQSAWDEVVPLLEARGHTALAVQLPGRGGDATPPGEVTLQDYVDTVLEIVRAQSEPVILVGHSFGGITISQVAETAPGRVSTLVYVAAYLPRNGDSLVTLSGEDRWNSFSEHNFLVSEDQTYARVAESYQLGLFCLDCSPDDEARVAGALLREPLAPLGTPVSLTEENFGSVRKVYVTTTRDNTVSWELQRIMRERTPVEKVLTLTSSHSPFLSMPGKLVEALTNVQ